MARVLLSDPQEVDCMAKRMFCFRIFLVLVLGGSAISAPTVTGAWNVAHMDTATIGGLEFGIKVPAAPYMWDLFDQGVAGGFISESGSPGWHVGSSVASYAPRYSTDHARRPGSLAAWLEFEGSNYNSTLALFNVPSSDWYISGWYFDDSVFSATRNEKVLSWRGAELGDPEVEPQFRYGFDSNEDGHTYITDCSGSTIVNDWSEPRKHQDEWRRLENFYGIGGSGNGTGLVQVWDNLQKTVDFNNADAGACDISHLYFHHYYSTSDASGNESAQNWYWDELYIDRTRARIEIGNAPTWNNCTHREIQIPVEWTDTQLSFIANQGSFGGEQLYLYVVDENGVTNPEGFPVVFGGGPPDPGPPGQPGQPEIEPR